MLSAYQGSCDDGLENESSVSKDEKSWQSFFKSPEWRNILSQHILPLLSWQDKLRVRLTCMNFRQSVNSSVRTLRLEHPTAFYTAGSWNFSKRFPNLRQIELEFNSPYEVKAFSMHLLTQKLENTSFSCLVFREGRCIAQSLSYPDNSPSYNSYYDPHRYSQPEISRYQAYGYNSANKPVTSTLDFTEVLLAVVCSCPQLKELRVEKSVLLETEAAAISKLKDSLRDLRLSTNCSSSPLRRPLVQLMVSNLPQLRTLRLAYIRDTTGDLAALFPLVGNLTHLELEYAHFGEGGAGPRIMASAVKHLRHLESLHLLECCVDDEMLSLICGISSLKSLIIQDEDAPEESCPSNVGLSCVGTLTQLERLELFGEELRLDRDLLTQLGKLPQLRYLAVARLDELWPLDRDPAHLVDGGSGYVDDEPEEDLEMYSGVDDEETTSASSVDDDVTSRPTPLLPCGGVAAPMGSVSGVRISASSQSHPVSQPALSLPHLHGQGHSSLPYSARHAMSISHLPHRSSLPSAAVAHAGSEGVSRCRLPTVHSEPNDLAKVEQMSGGNTRWAPPSAASPSPYGAANTSAGCSSALPCGGGHVEANEGVYFPDLNHYISVVSGSAHPQQQQGVSTSEQHAAASEADSPPSLAAVAGGSSSPDSTGIALNRPIAAHAALNDSSAPPQSRRPLQLLPSLESLTLYGSGGQGFDSRACSRSAKPPPPPLALLLPQPQLTSLKLSACATFETLRALVLQQSGLKKLILSHSSVSDLYGPQYAMGASYDNQASAMYGHHSHSYYAPYGHDASVNMSYAAAEVSDESRHENLAESNPTVSYGTEYNNSSANHASNYASGSVGRSVPYGGVTSMMVSGIEQTDYCYNGQQPGSQQLQQQQQQQEKRRRVTDGMDSGAPQDNIAGNEDAGAAHNNQLSANPSSPGGFTSGEMYDFSLSSLARRCPEAGPQCVLGFPEEISVGLAHLTVLRIKDVPGFGDAHLHALAHSLASLPSLQELKLRQLPGVGNAGIAALTKLTALRKLKLYGLGDVTNEGVAALAMWMPWLLEIKVCFCPWVTPVARDVALVQREAAHGIASALSLAVRIGPQECYSRKRLLRQKGAAAGAAPMCGAVGSKAY